MAQTNEHKRSGNRPPVFDNKVTRDKIDRHMSDINDRITEEDIRNVNTEPNEHYRVEKVKLEEGPDDIIIEDKDETRDEKKKEEGIETPWNILGA